jgi:hypothetical protein
MKKVLVLVMFLILSLAGTVCAFDVYETPPLFYLVAGSFQNADYAHTQQEKLLDAGYSSELLGYPIDGVLYWRVVVAQDPSKKNLEEKKSQLEKDGFEVFIAYDSADEPERPVSNPDPYPAPLPEDEIVNLIQKRFRTMEQFIIWLYDALQKY